MQLESGFAHEIPMYSNYGPIIGQQQMEEDEEEDEEEELGTNV
jgi:hypothetical protein